MMQITDNVRQELVKLVPKSLYNYLTCFVFYDNHPRDDKLIEVIVCTVDGEIKEFYKRDVVSSLSLDGISNPKEIKILRNGACELFYLVVAGDEIIIISRRERLKVHKRVKNVDKYEIDDFACRGQACLKIICKDDAVPMVFDDNFENLGDRALVLSGIHADDSLPILTQLMRKLIETKYSVKCNEKTLKEFLSLRQLSATSSYQEIHPNTDESVYRNTSQPISSDGIVNIKTQTPWVKICNKKIVIMLTFSYTHQEPITNVQILLHGINRPVMAYITRLFEKIEDPPFWRERSTTCVPKSNSDLALTAIINIEEIQLNVTSKIEFNGVLSYKRFAKEHLIPFDHVIVSALETMGEDFDVLSNNLLDEHATLAVLATTNKTEMILRHIRADEDEPLDVPKLFCSHLHMDMVEGSNNTVIHRISPYHVLNGIMLVFEKDDENTDIFRVSVYTRTSPQVLLLMHYIYEAIPNKIVLTTPDQRITAKSLSLSKYNEDLAAKPEKINYEGYATSLIKESEMLLEYFDNCMIKMSGIKDTEVNAKIGSEIDVFADGVPTFLKLRQNLLEEAFKGIKSISKEVHIKTGDTLIVEDGN